MDVAAQWTWYVFVRIQMNFSIEFSLSILFLIPRRLCLFNTSSGATIWSTPWFTFRFVIYIWAWNKLSKLGKCNKPTKFQNLVQHQPFGRSSELAVQARNHNCCSLLLLLFIIAALYYCRSVLLRIYFWSYPFHSLLSVDIVRSASLRDGITEGITETKALRRKYREGTITDMELMSLWKKLPSIISITETEKHILFDDLLSLYNSDFIYRAWIEEGPVASFGGPYDLQPHLQDLMNLNSSVDHIYRKTKMTEIAKGMDDDQFGNRGRGSTAGGPEPMMGGPKQTEYGPKSTAGGPEPTPSRTTAGGPEPTPSGSTAGGSEPTPSGSTAGGQNSKRGDDRRKEDQTGMLQKPPKSKQTEETPRESLQKAPLELGLAIVCVIRLICKMLSKPRYPIRSLYMRRWL